MNKFMFWFNVTASVINLIFIVLEQNKLNFVCLVIHIVIAILIKNKIICFSKE